VERTKILSGEDNISKVRNEMVSHVGLNVEGNKTHSLLLIVTTSPQTRSQRSLTNYTEGVTLCKFVQIVETKHMVLSVGLNSLAQVIEMNKKCFYLW
jgi:hypothetical protein